MLRYGYQSVYMYFTGVVEDESFIVCRPSFVPAICSFCATIDEVAATAVLVVGAQYLFIASTLVS